MLVTVYLVRNNKSSRDARLFFGGYLDVNGKMANAEQALLGREMTYSIPKSDILSGVQCPNCKAIPMIRVSAAWYCSWCKSYSKDAHIQTVRDYFLLMNAPLTVKEFQKFLLIEQRGVAINLLHSFNLPSTGKNEQRNTFSLPIAYFLL